MEKSVFFSWRNLEIVTNFSSILCGKNTNIISEFVMQKCGLPVSRKQPGKWKTVDNNPLVSEDTTEIINSKCVPECSREELAKKRWEINFCIQMWLLQSFSSFLGCFEFSRLECCDLQNNVESLMVLGLYSKSKLGKLKIRNVTKLKGENLRCISKFEKRKKKFNSIGWKCHANSLLKFWEDELRRCFGYFRAR